MFQKELAQRLAAGPGGKDYGRISVMVQYCADIRKVADVDASRFFPKPRIASQVLEIRFRHPPTHSVVSETDFFRLVKAAFSKRRKTLKNALAASELHLAPETARSLLEQAGIDPVRRAETLPVEEFVRLNKGMTAEISSMDRGM